MDMRETRGRWRYHCVRVASLRADDVIGLCRTAELLSVWAFEHLNSPSLAIRMYVFMLLLLQHHHHAHSLLMMDAVAVELM